jgi:hypothetical protein
MVSQIADIVRTTYKFVLSDGGVGLEEAEMSVCWLSAANPVADSDWNALLAEVANQVYLNWSGPVAEEHWETSVTLANVTARHEDTSGNTLQEQVFIPDPT